MRSLSVAYILRLWFHSVWILNHCYPSAVSPHEVQTAGVGFKEYWPELLEHMVWIHGPHVLKLTDGTSS